MRAASDFALYLMSEGLDTFPNTIDGNTKLQKLLVFADLISLAKYEHPLFNDEVLAFENGFVVENVRLRYAKDYFNFKKESQDFNPDFTIEEKDVLKYTTEIYGELSAKELSELSHDFLFWSKSFSNSLVRDNFRDKRAAVIRIEDMMNEIDDIRKVIKTHEQNKSIGDSVQRINGIKFYYSPDEITLTDDIVEQLYAFSETADDTAYSMYYDNDRLVIC